MKSSRLRSAFLLFGLTLSLGLFASPASAGPNGVTQRNGDIGGATATNVKYRGTTDGKVIPGIPKVYIVYWGTSADWGAQSTDSNGNLHFVNDTNVSSGAASSLQDMFQGLGTNGETWSNTITQYCDGAPQGSTSCDSTEAHVRYPNGFAWTATWHDTTDASVAYGDTSAAETALENEAIRAASHFGNTVTGSNTFALYVIAFPPGGKPLKFLDGNTDDAGICASHGVTSNAANPYIGFIVMPYVTDNVKCRLQNNSYTDDFTVAASHEYAEAVTDVALDGGWWDNNGFEVADGCTTFYQTSSVSVAMSTGTFRLTKVWSNLDGGCIGSGAANLGTTGIGRPYPESNNVNSVTDKNLPVSDHLSANTSTHGGKVFAIVSNPHHGSVTLDDPTTGDFTYTPAANYFGPDSFTFNATDNAGGISNTSVASISMIVPGAPALTDERTQCNNGADTYLIEWGPGSTGLPPTQYQVDYSTIPGTWTSFYTGGGIARSFGVHEGTVVNFRAKAFDGGSWSDYSQITFTAATCTLQ